MSDKFIGLKLNSSNVCDLVPFLHFKEREKHPWRSVTFKVLLAKGNTPPWVFFTFFKLKTKWYQIAHCINIIFS